MAASDATPFPIKNTAYRITFPILDNDGDLVTGAAGLDSEVSKDGGTFADCTNEATEIATSSGIYYLDLSSTEMNADTVAIIVKTSTTDAKTTTIVLHPQEAGDIKVDIESISGDSTAADNLELMYDGTGYTDETGPASRGQVSGIGAGSGSALNFPVSADNTGGAIIDSVTFVGSQTGTYTNTEANLGTFHQITHSSNAFDLVYRLACGDTRTAVSVTINTYLNGSNDEASIQVYDHVGSDWETLATIDGINGSTITEYTLNLFEKHTGVLGSSEAGNVYIRFVCSAQSAPVLYIARVFASAVAATSTMGYEGGKVWANEATGTSTGTTLGIDGTFANQSDDFDNAQDIADALGTSFINIHPGDSITLSDSLEGYVISMVQATVDGGSQDVGSTRFNEGVYQGVFTRTSGFPSFADGRLFGASSLTLPQFVAFRCSVVGTLTLSEAANQSLIDCQAGGTATIDCGSLGSGFILNLVRWSGNVTFNNLASGAVVNILGDACGDIVLNGADATVNIDGTVATVTNNLTGSPTVTDNSISRANINTEADTAISDASLATAGALATVDTNVDSILADTGTDGVAISAASANKIADHTIRRSFATAAASSDGDTKTGRSLLGAIAKLVNKLSVSGSTLTVTEADDSTALFTQTVTSDSGADPITALDTD